MGLPEELSEIKGILSLKFFEDLPFTLDFNSHNLIGENEASLLPRVECGIAVPVVVKKDGPSTDIFIHLKLPSGKIINVEVDTGSDILILNENFMEELGVIKESNSVKKVEGTDETGNRFTRYLSNISGTISLDGRIYQSNPEVMFQRILHEGIIGHSFLRRYIVTLDLPRSRMIFSFEKSMKSDVEI